MRILIVCEDIDRSERALYIQLKRGGHDLDVLCQPEANWKGSLRSAGVPAELRDAGMQVEDLVVRHRLDARAVRTIRRRLLAHTYDVCYAPLNRTLSTSLLAARGTATRVVGYRGTLGHISRWDPACWLTYLNPRVARILCVSDAVRHYLLSAGVRHDRLVTLYKGHDPDWYSGTPPISREAIGVPASSFMLVFTGNIRPVKGVDVLLDACKLVPASVDLRLVLVGEIKDDRVQQQLDDPEIADRVITTGYRADALSIVAAGNAYVMPSIDREGLPRGVIEAMCLAKPVIVTRVGGLPELVTDPECGWVVPPRDPAALAAAISDLARDAETQQRRGAAALERIRSDFHIRSTARAVERVFMELAGERKPA